MSSRDGILLDWRSRRIAAAYRAVFATGDGQTVLRDLLRLGGVLATSFEPDPQVTAFQEGRRSLALEIINRLRWSEDALIALARERQFQVGQQAAQEGNDDPT